MKWVKIIIQWWALVHMTINLLGTKNRRILLIIYASIGFSRCLLVS